MKFNFGPRAIAFVLIATGLGVKALIAWHTGSAEMYSELAKDATLLTGAGLLAYQHPTSPA